MSVQRSGRHTDAPIRDVQAASVTHAERASAEATGALSSSRCKGTDDGMLIKKLELLLLLCFLLLEECPDGAEPITLGYQALRLR